MKLKFSKFTLLILGMFFTFSFPVFSNNAYTIQYKEQVNKLLNTSINPQHMWDDLTHLVTYTDRGPDHLSGKNAALWIENQLNIMKQQSGRTDVTVYQVATKWTYPDGDVYEAIQPSIILRIGNAAQYDSQPAVIIGAHIDTVSCLFDGCVDDEGKPDKEHGMGGPFPGADDDGTGIAAVLDVARTLLFSHLQFKKPIYLIWYAAEEYGTLGSYAVVNDFKMKKIPVDAVLQLDMLGYTVKNDTTMWIAACKNLDTNLTNYLETLITTYLPDRRVKKVTACDSDSFSDDRAWTESGFKAARPMEYSTPNPYLHTSDDTVEKLSLSHMTDYLKLAVAFAVELAEPIKSQ